MYGRDRRCQATESIHSQRTWYDADPHGMLQRGSGGVELRLGGKRSFPLGRVLPAESVRSPRE